MNTQEIILLSLVTALIGSSLSGIIYNYYTKRRDERRSLYSKGLKLLSDREELYYMILRRDTKDKSRKYELISLMHKNQAGIFSHQAVLEVDSYWVGESYRNAVKDFRTKTEQLLRDAWTNPLEDPSGSVPKDRRINTTDISQKHAKDCRRRLNPLRSTFNTLTRWIRI